MHQRLRDQHRWLAAVLRGHYAYFGIPGNSTCLGRFHLQVMKAWRRVLLRRSQRPKLSWERFNSGIAAAEAAGATVIVVTATHTHPMATSHPMVASYEGLTAGLDAAGRLTLALAGTRAARPASS